MRRAAERAPCCAGSRSRRRAAGQRRDSRERSQSGRGVGKTSLNCGVADVVQAAPQVRGLILEGCRWADDLGPLAGLSLTFLMVRGCEAAADISVCARLRRLRELFLSSTPVADLTPLAGLSKLENLGPASCCNISDLSPLASLPRLERLDLTGTAPGLDLTPLHQNRKLAVHIAAGQEVRGAEAFGRQLKVS